MPDDFRFDVFLSHSSKDKPVVRDIAERLKKDGLKVWFDEWVHKPGDSIPAKIEEGLEHSRVLVLCLSANAFGSNHANAGLVSRAFRFIPQRVDDALSNRPLAQLRCINRPPSSLKYTTISKTDLPTQYPADKNYAQNNCAIGTR